MAGPDGETLVHLLALDDFFYAFRHQTFSSVGTVVGHDNDFVGAFAHLLSRMISSWYVLPVR